MREGMTETTSRRAWVQQIMGMPISVHLRGPHVDTPAVHDRVDEFFNELRTLDALFSPYRPDSEISRLNRGAITVAQCSPVVGEVVALCDRARAVTQGAFDAGELPLPDGGAGFDPSGLVKGWAVERANRHLGELGDYGRILNAGGDVLVSPAPDGQPWRVGIEDPTRDGHLLEVLELRAGAVATSGTARRGRHIIDPGTGRAAGMLVSATVVGPRLLWADVYATAAVARGPGALDWLNGLAGYEALLVETGGRRHTTRLWPGRSFGPAPIPDAR
jgi:thiamine biosynthesis lipoprotein